ncbi:hypothetical protein MNBD_GAMMA10-1309, partial [hydrothermal vent metagenome]
AENTEETREQRKATDRHKAPVSSAQGKPEKLISPSLHFNAPATI